MVCINKNERVFWYMLNLKKIIIKKRLHKEFMQTISP